MKSYFYDKFSSIFIEKKLSKKKAKKRNKNQSIKAGIYQNESNIEI